MADTIKEFLVALGFKTDESALKNFREGISRAEKVVVGFAAAVEVAADAIAYGVAKMASNLEALYFASLRTNTAASSLRALDRAAQSFGASAGDALSSAEGLARFFRQNPGGGNYVNALLGRVGESAYGANGQLKDTSELMVSLGHLFAANKRSGNEFQNYQISSMLGIDEKTMLAIMDGSFGRKLDEERRKFQESGMDKATEGAHTFMNSLRNLGDELGNLGVRVQAVLQEKFGKTIAHITAMFQKDGAVWADDIASFIGYWIEKFNDLLNWIDTHRKEIHDGIAFAFHAVKEAYDFLEPILKWVLNKFIELDHATNGWSTKLIALIILLKSLGLFSIVSGIAKMAIGMFRFGGALMGLEAGAAVLAGIAASIGVIGAAIGGWKFGEWLNDNTNIQQWIGDKVEGAQKLFSDAWHPGQSIVRGLMDQGLNHTQAVGLASNMMAESGGSIYARNGTHYGLMQWDATRQADYSKWAKSQGYRDTDIHDAREEDQLAFAAYELRHNPRFAQAWKLLSASNADTRMGADQAARIISTYVEVPSTTKAGLEREATARGGRAANMWNLENHVVVHSANDPHKTAEMVRREVERTWQQMTRDFVALGIE